MVMMPVGVVQAQERDEREPQVVYLDAEAQVIDELLYDSEGRGSELQRSRGRGIS